MKKIFIFSIIFSLLISSTLSKKNDIPKTEITITSEFNSAQVKHEENLHLFSAKFDKGGKKFIFLEVVHQNTAEEYNHIFVSIPEVPDKVPTYQESDYKTIEKDTNLIINLNAIESNTASIVVECKDACDFIIYYQLVDNIPLTNDRSIDLIADKNDEINVDFEPEVVGELNNIITFMSGAPSNFTVDIKYNSTFNADIFKKFINGYGIYLDSVTYPYLTKFTFIVKGAEYLHITNRKLATEPKNLILGDYMNLIVGDENLINECFNLPKKAQEDPDKNYNLNFLTFTRNLKVVLDDLDNILVTSNTQVIQIDAKKYSKICFESNDVKVATASFQILDGTEQTSSQDLQKPINRGMPTKFKLKKGQLAYYRLNYYDLETTKLYLNLKATEGRPTLYYGKCTNYPNCNFQVEQLAQLETTRNINNNYMIRQDIDTQHTKPYCEPEFQTAVVYCQNEETDNDCEYYVTLYNNNDGISLMDDLVYYTSSINDDESAQITPFDKYYINIKDVNDEYKHLNIYFNIFSGYLDIKVFSNYEMTEEVTTQIVSATNYMLIKISADSLPANSLVGEYYIQVKYKFNTIYTIGYTTLVDETKKNYLITNEVNLRTIQNDKSDNIFLIKNNLKDKKVPFIYQYNSLNCDLEVSLKGESDSIKERNHQFIIDESKAYYNDEYYEMTIKAIKPDIEGVTDTFLCLVSITGSEIDTQKEIFLGNGIIQTGKLTKKFNYINYIFPFNLNPFNLDGLSLLFQKNSKYPVDLSYAFGNSQEFTTYNITSIEKTFSFNKEEYDQFKLSQYNTLQIKLKIDENVEIKDDTIIDFELKIIYDETYPIYLTKDKYHKLILPANEINMYTFEIGKNEECDIYLDFNDGFGLGEVVVIPKEENKIKSYKKFNEDKKYMFDLFTKEYQITKEMTSTCEKGCDVEIVIDHREESHKNTFFSYGIYYRKNNNIVNLPQNTIAHGNLRSVDEKNIYQTQIVKDSNLIIFGVEGENIKVCIKKGDTVPTPDSCDIFIDSSKNKFYELKAESGTFEGQIFTYIIYTEKLEFYNFRSYEFRVGVPDSDQLRLNTIDMNHNAQCYFNKETLKLYYILPIEKYNKEERLYIFSPDNKNVLINAKSYIMEEYDRLTMAEKISNLPKTDSSSTNYLIFDINRKEGPVNSKDIYVIIVIEHPQTEQEVYATLAIGGFLHAEMSYLRPRSYSFYYINKNAEFNSLNLEIQSQNYFKINFVQLSQTGGIITFNNTETKYELGEKTLSYTLMTQSDIEYKTTFKVDIKNNNNDLNELYFYTYLDIRQSTMNIDEIKKNNLIQEKFEYLPNDQLKKSLPMSFYQKIPKDINNDKQFTFQILDSSPSSEALHDKKIVIFGYIFNRTTLEEVLEDPTLLENKEHITVGSFGKKYLTANIIFGFDKIKQYAVYDENYFVVCIKDSDGGEIKFNQLSLNLLQSSLNYITMNEYEGNLVKGKETKNLLQVQKDGTLKMAIEVFVDGKSNIDDYTFAVRIYHGENDDYSTNDTTLIEDKETIKDHQKIKIMLYIRLGTEFIVLNLINKNNNNDVTTYYVKYRVDTNNPTYYYLDSNRTIDREIKEKKVKMKFNNVQECIGDKCTIHDNFQVEYDALFYDKNTPDNIKNIIVGQVPLLTKEIIKTGAETKNLIEWEIDLENDFDRLNGSLVQVIAYGKYEDNSELFVYDVFRVVEDENTPENRDFEFYIILICYVAIIVLTFSGLFIYFYATMEIGRNTLIRSGVIKEDKLVDSTRESRESK